MTIYRKGLVVEVIGWSCNSIVLLILESVFASVVVVWARVGDVVGAPFRV